MRGTWNPSPLPTQALTSAECGKTRQNAQLGRNWRFRRAPAGNNRESSGSRNEIGLREATERKQVFTGACQRVMAVSSATARIGCDDR